MGIRIIFNWLKELKIRSRETCGLFLSFEVGIDYFLSRLWSFQLEITKFHLLFSPKPSIISKI